MPDKKKKPQIIIDELRAALAGGKMIPTEAFDELLKSGTLLNGTLAQAIELYSKNGTGGGFTAGRTYTWREVEGARAWQAEAYEQAPNEQQDAYQPITKIELIDKGPAKPMFKIVWGWDGRRKNQTTNEEFLLEWVREDIIQRQAISGTVTDFLEYVKDGWLGRWAAQEAVAFLSSANPLPAEPQPESPAPMPPASPFAMVDWTESQPASPEDDQPSIFNTVDWS